MSYIQGSMSVPYSPKHRGDPPTNSLLYTTSRLVTQRLAQARTGINATGPSLLQVASGLDDPSSHQQYGRGSGSAGTANGHNGKLLPRTPLVIHIRVRPSLPVSFTDAGLVPSSGRADEILVSSLNSFSHFLETSGADLVGNPPSTDPMHYSCFVQRPALLRPGLLEGAKRVARRLDRAYTQGKPFKTHDGRPASPFRHTTDKPRKQDQPLVESPTAVVKPVSNGPLLQKGSDSIFGNIPSTLSYVGARASSARSGSVGEIPIAVESGSSSSSSDEGDNGKDTGAAVTRRDGASNNNPASFLSTDNNNQLRQPSISSSHQHSSRQSSRCNLEGLVLPQRRGSRMSFDGGASDMSFDQTSAASTSHIDNQFFEQRIGSASDGGGEGGATSGNLLMNVPTNAAVTQRPKRSETTILDEDYEECGPDIALCRFASNILIAHRDQIKSMRQELEKDGYNSRKVMRLCEFMLRDAAAVSVSERDLVKQWDPTEPSPWEDDADDPMLAHEDETRNIRTPDPNSMYDVPAPTIPSSKGGLLEGSYLTDASRARHLMQEHHIESRRRREEAADAHRVLEVFVMLREPFILSEQLVFREVKTRSAVLFVWEQSWKALRLYEQLWFSRSLAAQHFRERNTVMQQQAIGSETKCRAKIWTGESEAWSSALEAFYERYKDLEYGMTAQYHLIRTLRERLRSELDSGVAEMHGGTNPYTKPIEEAMTLLEKKRRQQGGPPPEGRN